MEPSVSPADSASQAVEIRHLHAFSALAEHLNFTRAAESLNMTQPAFSRTIAQLERIVSVPLAHRTKRSVRLSAAGHEFLIHGRRAIACIEDAVSGARGKPPVLRVAFTWGAAARYSAPAVREFEWRHPDVTVELRRIEDNVAGLGDGRADVGFLPGEVRDDRVETMVLTEEPRVAAMPSDHPLASKREIQLADLRTETMVINVVSGTTSPTLWTTGSNEPPPVVPVRNIEEWLEAIAAGRGIGTSLATTGRLYSHPGIAYRPILGCPPVPLTLAWPRRGKHPLVDDFVSVAQTVTARR